MARHLFLALGLAPGHGHPPPMPPNTCAMRAHGIISSVPPHCQMRKLRRCGARDRKPSPWASEYRSSKGQTLSRCFRRPSVPCPGQTRQCQRRTGRGPGECGGSQARSKIAGGHANPEKKEQDRAVHTARSMLKRPPAMAGDGCASMGRRPGCLWISCSEMPWSTNCVLKPTCHGPRQQR